jgi:U3 small nucleolar RNA-associated protein 21
MSTDGNPIMISGSNLGHMAIWNLEEKRLVAQVREAHGCAVDGMHAMQLEPLMVTSSADNSVKVWIFDMSDGSARLLRHRSGHSLPPTRIRFHDQAGASVLSAGADSCLMAFSTIHDSRNKSLGRASFNKAETRKSGLRLDEHRMPPVIEFSSSEAKQSDWDGVVCVHENLRAVTTWDFVKSSMGKHRIDPERFKENERLYGSTTATVSSNYFFFLLISLFVYHLRILCKKKTKDLFFLRINEQKSAKTEQKMLKAGQKKSSF